jgi:hypothetical protein
MGHSKWLLVEQRQLIDSLVLPALVSVCARGSASHLAPLSRQGTLGPGNSPPVKFLGFPINVRAIWIALFPFMYPTCDTEYLGGIDTSICTWSRMRCPSSIRLAHFCQRLEHFPHLLAKSTVYFGMKHNVEFALSLGMAQAFNVVHLKVSFPVTLRGSRIGNSRYQDQDA